MLEILIWAIMAGIVAVDVLKYFFTPMFTNTKIAEQED